MMKQKFEHGSSNKTYQMWPWDDLLDGERWYLIGELDLSDVSRRLCSLFSTAGAILRHKVAKAPSRNIIK